jgi:hypothetical protein
MRPILLLALALLAGCAQIPEGVEAVHGFDAGRYLGRWYEIARLDHSFERGLDNISATYTPRDDGGIDVLNRGYDRADGQWREARGLPAVARGRADAQVPLDPRPPARPAARGGRSPRGAGRRAWFRYERADLGASRSVNAHPHVARR